MDLGGESQTRRRVWWVSLGLVVAVGAVYWAAPFHDFINYDDPQYVTQSPITQRGLTLEGIAWAFSDVSTGNWHPLTRLSHMLDCQLFGVRAGAHHAVNVIVHAANSVLLLLALRRLTGAFWRSAMVAALFAVHPLHVESVAWISERKDMLSAFFWITGMYAYAVYAERASIARYLAVAGLFALGLMAKPMVITFPAALLLLDVWPLRRFSRAAVFEKFPMFVVGIATALLTLALQEHAFNQAKELTLALRVENAFAAYLTYLKQTFWPTDLAIFYPHPLSNLSTTTWVWGATIVAAASIVASLALRRAPYLFVGWFWFVGTLLPVIGIVQAGLQGRADRYTYLPHIGLFIAVVWLVAHLIRVPPLPQSSSAPKSNSLPLPLKRIVAVLSCVVLLALGIVSMRQHAYWKNTVTVFERDLAVTENNKLAHLVLGTEYARLGDPAAAEEHFYAAIQIEGDTDWTQDMPEGHFALGLLAERQGDFEEAARQYAKAIELNERFSEAHNNLAGAYMELGRVQGGDYYARAREHALRALELDPENDQAAANAAFLALFFEDYAESVRLHELALPHFPDNAPMHRNMALALFKTGDVERAITYAEKAVELDPDFDVARADLARYREALKQR